MLKVKIPLFVFTISAIATCLGAKHVGTIFFLNHTSSMPRGIYMKIRSDEIKKGDIIVFNSPHFNGNLIKYVLAISEAEFCFDEEGTLWVDKNPIAQRSIYKYSFSFGAQYGCQHLKNEELLVIGEHPDSYDSRYFGAIKKEDIIATVRCVFHFKK